MDWDKLKAFYEVAINKSISRASYKLNISQSAISRQIQDLEFDLKTSLFTRHQKGVKLTEQRKIVAKVMSEANDHPDVDELYNRVSKIDSKISIATVYRTVKLFEESGILAKLEFKGGKARYEELNEGHHDHLIDIKSGEIIEFVDEEIEKLQKKVAEKYGYNLVDHKLELYGVKKNK